MNQANQIKDIHDIRGPVVAGFNPDIITVLLIIVFICLVIALLWYGYKLFKKLSLKKKKTIPRLPPPLPAEDIALLELNSILDYMEKDKRIFYFKLTAIFKKYISKKFKINALEMTSQELNKSIKTLRIRSNFLLKTSSFLNFSDNIKYAAMPASTEDVKKNFDLIKDFIKSEKEAE